MSTNVTKHMLMAPWVPESLPAAPTLAILVGGAVTLAPLAVQNGREYWLSGDNHPDGVDESYVGRGDLLCVLSSALQEAGLAPTLTVTDHVLTIATDSDFTILWSHGASHLPGYLFGFVADAASASSTITAPNQLYGRWIVDRPINIDTLDNRTANSLVNTTTTGLTDHVYHSESRGVRTVEYRMMPEASIIESVATHPHLAFGYYWRTAWGRGYPMRIYRDVDVMAQGVYETYRMAETSEVPYVREDPTTLRWAVTLPLRLVTQQQRYDLLTQSADAGVYNGATYLYPFDSATELTVACYTKATTGELVDRTGSGTEYLLQTNGGAVSLQISTGVLTTTTAPMDGEWHHIAAVYDGTQLAELNRVKLYVDGVLQPTTLTTAGIPTSTSVSDAGDAVELSAIATLSSVAVWQHALNATQVEAIYSAMPFELQYMHSVPPPTHLWFLNGDGVDAMANTDLVGVSDTYAADEYPGKCGVSELIDGYSLRLNDFTNASGSYVTLGELNYTGNATISVSWWLKRDHTASDNGFAWFSGGTSTAYGQFRAEMRTDDVRLGIGNTTNGQYDNIRTFANALTTGEWVHILAVFDGAGATNDDRLKCYYNGVEATGVQTSGTVPTAIGNHVNNNPSAWLLGGQSTKTLASVTNVFDDTNVYQPCIYGPALTAADAVSLYNAGAPIDPASIAGLEYRWVFDDAVGVYPTIPANTGGSDGTGYRGDAADLETDIP